MNLGSYRRYVEDMVSEAISKGGGSAKGALQWLTTHQTTWKRTIFTLNPTEKTQAYIDSSRYLDILANKDSSDKSQVPLNPNEVIKSILVQRLGNPNFWS